MLLGKNRFKYPSYYYLRIQKSHLYRHSEGVHKISDKYVVKVVMMKMNMICIMK